MDRRTVILSLFAGLGGGAVGSVIRAGDKPADPAVFSTVVSCGGHTCGVYFDPFPGCQTLSMCDGESCSSQFVCRDHDCVDVHTCTGGPGSHGCMNYHFYPQEYAPSVAQVNISDARGRLAAMLDIEDADDSQG